MRAAAGLLLCAALVAGAPGRIALAGEPQEPPGSLLNLSAAAEREVPNDEFAAVLAVERSDRTSAATQVAVNQVVDSVSHSAQAAGLQFETAGYETSRIDDPAKPGSTSPPPFHWVTRATTRITSHDLLALERWLGSVSADVAIERIVSSLRRETRDGLVASLRADAIAAFRAKARAAAAAFGYARYEVAQVSLNDGGDRPPPFPMAEAGVRMSLARAEAPPVTISQGRSTVTVSVSGSVRLLEAEAPAR